MSWGDRARRGRVRVRGGRNYAGMSLGRGNSVFMDKYPFSALYSEDNDDSDTPGGYVDRKKERQDKKRQRVSTGTSGDEIYDLYDDDEEEDDDDNINDDGDNGDFMRISTVQK